MAYVITEPCVGTCDAACVSVCPVDCIQAPVPLAEIAAVPREKRRERFPGMQLFIDPDECISCGSCVPECPVGAIFDEDEVPEKWRSAVESNAAFFANGVPR